MRVEAVRRGKDHFYRLIHGDSIIDGLAITTVQRLPAEAGVDMADLAEADPHASSQHTAPGAA